MKCIRIKNRILISLFIIVASLLYILPAEAQVINKTIKSIKLENATLEQSLKSIEKLTGLGYLTKGENIESVKGINYTGTNVNVETVLRAILNNTGFTYEINNNVILIIKAQTARPPARTEQRSYTLSGRVLDDKTGAPLNYATVLMKNSNRFAITDEKGEFLITLPSGSITLVAAILGYERIERNFNLAGDITGITFRLQEQNLSLDEVIVTAQTTQSDLGSSTYKIGEQAIQQIQPISVRDILQLLPGAKISNPDLTEVGQVTLRTAAPDNSVFSNVNAFGTSIIIDGARMSNDANMQSDNPSVGTSGGRNTVNRGIDLRQISASTIESVEIVEGVANAKYGNLTSGAVIIKRKAGETPLNIGFNAFPSSYQTNISKGFLTEKYGGFNVNVDYAFANQSPVSKKYFYQRINSGLRWTYVIDKKRNWRNTVSYDLMTQFDGTRFEPEESVHSFRKTRNSNHTLNIYGGLDFLGRLSYTFNANYAYQYTLFEDYKSDGPLPTIEATEAGTYYGGFTPIGYLTKIEMIGAPLSVNAKIEHEQNFNLSGALLSMNYGIDFSYDKNFGKGRNIQGASLNLNFPGNRAAFFHEIPASVIYSAYLQNDLTREFKNQIYVFKAGLRYDNMLGRYNLLSPRLSMSAKYFNLFRLRAAWGLSYKAPSMLNLNPGPIYIDIENLSWFTNNPLERLAIITTFIYQPDNSHLQPSRGETKEFGFDIERNGFNLNITGYRTELTNGISTSSYLKILPNQRYNVVSRPENRPPIVEPGQIVPFPRVYYEYNNNLYTKTDGLTFSAMFPRISATNTRVSLSGAYNKTFTQNNATTLNSAQFVTGVQQNRFGVYQSVAFQYDVLRSNLTIIQHIPTIRLLITLMVETSWFSRREAIGSSIYPIAYYDVEGNYYDIPESERSSPEYENLFLQPYSYEYFPEPAYSNFHLQVRKETRQGHSFSFFANNFWWYNPTYYDDISLSMKRLNSPISFGFGVTFKL